MVKRYMYIMHCTYTSFYHVRFTSNYETYMCMYILVDITLVLYLRLWDTIYCIHTAKYRVQQLCMWCGLMSKVLKNGQCRAGQRPDSISCRKYTEVNNCVAYHHDQLWSGGVLLMQESLQKYLQGRNRQYDDYWMDHSFLLMQIGNNMLFGMPNFANLLYRLVELPFFMTFHFCVWVSKFIWCPKLEYT